MKWRTLGFVVTITSTPSNSTCLMTAMTTFSDNWDNFFKIVMIADPVALILLDFLIWLRLRLGGGNGM